MRWECAPVRAGAHSVSESWFAQARLEDKLHRKLYLPGGTGIAGGESGIRYHSEAGAADGGDTPGLAKVRVIEDVEHFSPELELDAFGQFRRLQE